MKRVGFAATVFVYLFSGLFAYGIPSFSVNVASAAASNQLPFSARLTTSSGFNVADGSYVVTFSLYTAATGGTPIWSENQTVDVTRGEFAAYLGAVNPLTGVNFSQPNLYLGFKVGSDPEMTPRYQVGSVPSAITANQLNGRDATAYFQKDQNETVTGSSVFTGGFAVQPASLSGTALLVNAGALFNGSLASLQVGGVNQYSISSVGAVTQAGSLTVSSGGASITGNSSITGNLVITGTLSAAGSSQSGQLTNTFSPADPNAAWAIAAQGAPLNSANGALLALGANFTGVGATKFVGSISGTQLGINAQPSFAGNLLDAQVGGSSKFSASSTGAVTTASTLTVTSGGINVAGGGLAVTGNSSVTGTFNVSSTLTASAGISLTGGLNNNNGGVTNTGAISGATTIATSGAINGATISGGTLTGGSLSAVAVNGLSVVGGLITSGTWNGSAISPQYGGLGINTSGSTGVPTVSSGSWSINSTLAATLGGTGQTSVASGDLLYGSAANTWSRLSSGTNGQCLVQLGGLPAWGSCALSGSGSTLDAAYFNGNVINTTSAKDITFNLNKTAVDSNFIVSIANNATGYASVVRQDGVGPSSPAQLFLLQSLNTTIAQPVALKIIAAAGGITTALDASGTNIVTALATGSNNLNGTNWSIQGSSGNINTSGTITSGLINGQTISNTANFTGTVVTASNLTVTSGGLTVSAGGIGVTGNSTIAGTLSGLTGLTVGGAGLTVTAGGASITGASSVTGTLAVSALLTSHGINNNTNGITNAGAISGVTTIGASGVITGGTLTDGTASITAGAITGVTTLSTLGTINGATISGGSLSAGAVNGLSVAAGVVSAGTWNGTPVGVLYGGTGSTTAAGARANLSAAVSGANADITSLSGLTSALSVTQGGTGVATAATNGLLFGNGTGALQVTAAGTSGQLMVASAVGVPTFVTLSSDATLTNTGALTLTTVNATTGSFGTATQIPQITVDGKGRITSAANVTISGTTPGGAASNDLSGTYPGPTVARINGVALGLTTATAGNLLIGSSSQWVSQAVSGDVALGSTGIVTIGAGAVTGGKIAGNTITAANLSSGDFSSKITSGTYSINISGNAATVTNGVYTTAANIIVAQANAAVPLSIKPVAATGTGDILDLYNTAGTIGSSFDSAGLFHGSAAGIAAATIANASLANSSVTVTAGTGLSGGGTVALGGSITITNAGVTGITGTANQVIASASTGGITLSLPQSIGTASTPTFGGATINGAVSGITTLSTSGTINGATISGGSLSGTAVNGLNVASGLITSGTWQGSTVAVGYGGTGVASATTNGVIYGNGAGALQVTAAGTSGQLLVANVSGVPTFVSVSGDATLGNTGVLALTTVNATTGSFGTATQIPQIVIDGKGRITSAANVTISGTTPGGAASGDLSGSYPNPTVAKINTVALGLTTATAGNLLIGTGAAWATSSLSGDAALTSGGVLTVGTGAITGTKIASNTITAANLASGDFSTKITSGTYSVNISGNAATVTNGVYTNVANVLTAPSNAAVPLSIKPVAATGTADTLDLYNTAGAVASSFDKNGLFNGSGAGITAGTIANGALANNSVTVTAGTGLSGGGNVALGSAITITNAGVTSLTGTANQVIVSSATGAVTLSLPQSIATSSTPTFAGATVNGSTAINLTNPSSSGISSVSGLQVALTGTATTGTNTNTAINLPGIFSAGNNTNVGIAIGTGFADLLRYNGTSLINGTGILQSAGVSGSYTGITGVGTIGTGTWQATAIGAAYGGTGLSSYTVGDLLYASGATALSKLAAVAAGSILVSNGAGAAPAYSSSPVLTTSLTAPVLNATTALQLGGVNINTGATLSNVAYLDQSQTLIGTNTFSQTGANAVAVTGAPLSSATSSLIRVGNTIASGNSAANGGTYLSINAPAAGAGSAADFINLQGNGASKFKVDAAGNITGASFSGTVGDTNLSSNVALLNRSGQTFTGTDSFTAAGTGLAVTNNETVGGTLIVTGATTVGSLSASNGGITNAGAVSGVTTLATTGAINGQTISAAANFTGTVTTAGQLTVSAGGLAVTGNSTLAGTLGGLAGLTLASGNITQTGTGTLSTGTGAISLNGDTTIAAGKSLILTGGTSFPGSAVAGQQFFRTDLKHVFTYQNGQWQSNNTVATYTISASNSANPGSADYQATGTADQTIINSAITALPSTGGIIYLLDGTFNTTDSITIAKSNVTLMGAGTSTIINRTGATTNSLISLGNGGTTAYSGITISDLSLVGTSNASTYAVTFNQSISYSTVRSVQMNVNGYASVYLGAADAAHGDTYNTIANTTTIGTSAIDITNASNNLIANNKGTKLIELDSSSKYNRIIGNNVDPGSGFAGIIVWQSSAYNTVSGNTVNGITYGPGINLDTTTNNVITNNVVNASAWSGISVANSSSGNTVSGNVLSNNLDAGVSILTGSTNNVVTGNTLINNGGSGAINNITVSGSSINNIVSSNTITDTAGTGYAIAIDGTSNGNTLSNNRYSGTGATAISDAATTVYSGQLNGSVLQLSGASDVSINGAHITTAGVISSATWQGSTVAVQYGGTGATTFATNGVLYGNGTSALSSTAAGTTGQCLVGATGSAPAWGACASGTAYTLQQSYNAGSAISTNNAQDLAITLAHTATDSNFTVNIAAASTGKFAIQNAGSDVLRVTNAGGTHVVSGGLTIDVGGLAVSAGGITATGQTIAAGTLNATSNIQLGGVNINTAGTLSNIAYQNQANSFTAGQTITTGGLNLTNSGITNAGAISGATSVANSGGYTQTGTTANTFTGASSFTAAATGLTVTNNATVGSLTTAGNFIQTGTSTISTGTGAISLNGDTTIAANKSLILTGGTSFPGSPVAGQVFFRTDLKHLYSYQNSQWQTDNSVATLTVTASNSLTPGKGDYQATGTNDQVTINAAIAALPAAGGIVYLSEGTFTTGAAIIIAKSNVTLMGAGKGTVITRTWAEAVANNSGTITLGDGTSAYSGITIENLSINGNKAGYASTANDHGIMLFRLISASTLTQTWIDSVKGNGIHLYDAASSNKNIVISSNQVTNAGQSGLYATGSNALYSNLNISNNVFNVNGLHGLFFSTIHGSTIAGNQLASNTSDGIQLNGYNNTVTNNVVSYSGARGIYVTGGANTIGNNISIHNTLTGILVFSSTYNSVTGNNLQDNLQGGINLNSSNNNIVSGNFLNLNGGATYSGIIINGSNNQVIGNQIVHTTGTGYAIDVQSGSANYLSSNTYSGAGAASINDAGNSTIFASQIDGNGNINTRGQAGIGFNTLTPTASLQNAGAFINSVLTTPAAPTVYVTGVAGSTTYGYKVTAYDGLGETLASTETQVTTGNATLTGSNYNLIVPVRIPGAVSYKVYRTTAAGTPATTGLIGTIAGGATTFSLSDTGLSIVGGVLTVPTVNTTGGLQVAGTTTSLTGTPVALATSSLLQLGTAIVTGSASGTYLGLNTPGAYTGNLVDLQVNGASKFKVDSAGTVTTGGLTLAGNAIYPTAGVTLNLGASSASFINIAPSSSAITSTTVIGVQIASNTFNPVSGTGIYNFIQSSPTVNQTGGANGITRGLYINPTLTAAADFRALQVGIDPNAASTGALVQLGSVNTLTSGSASGTFLGINSANTFAGNFIDIQKNGVGEFKVDASGNLSIAGTQVCTSAGCTSASGSGSYIQNGTSLQASSNFNISGNGQIGGTLAVTGAATVGSLNASNGGITNAGSITGIGANLTAAGATTLQATAGTLALAATGANIITASTNGLERLRIDATGNVGIGRTAPIAQLDVAGKAPVAAGSALVISGSRGPGSLAVQNRYAYIANGNTLQIADVSNPASPVSVSTLTLTANGGLEGIAVQGRYAFVANSVSNTLQAIDISNPSAMTLVGTVSTGTYPDAVSVQGRYVYLTMHTGGIQIFDASNPAAMVLVSTLAFTGSGTTATLSGHYMFVSNFGTQVQAIDISNPLAPVIVGAFTTISASCGIASQGRYLYVTTCSASYIQVIDISNPASMVSAGTLATTGAVVFDVAVQGRYAYAVNNSAPNYLETFDISNPASMTSVGTAAVTGGAPSIIVQGRYAYVATNSRLQAFDLGGAYLQQLEAGGIETGTLAVKQSASIDGGLSVTGATAISGSLQAKSLGIYGGSSYTGNLLSLQANGGQALALSQSGNVTQSAFSFQNVYQTTTAEATFTDVSPSANSSANWNLFKNAAILNDRTYFGYYDGNFKSMYFTKNAGTQTTGTITWEVCTAVTSGACTTWSAISGGSDGTTNLTASGLVSWTNTAVQATVNGTSAYWLRATVATAAMSVQANGTLAVSNPGTVIAHLIQPAGQAASGAFSANGTLYAANAATGFAGNLIDLQVAGTSKFKYDAGSSNLNIGANFLNNINNSVGFQGSTINSNGTGLAFAGPGATVNASHGVAFSGGTANGDTSFAFGGGVVTGGSNSFAFGRNSSTGANFTIATGDSVQANGLGSILLSGTGACGSTTTGYNSFALGSCMQAAASYSYVLGHGTSNNGLINNITGSLIYGTNNNTATLYTRGGGSYVGAGTVATTSGSTTVTGTTTTFTADFIAGDRITVGGNTYTVASITSATVLALTANAAVTVAGSAYTVLPSLFKIQDASANPVLFASDQGNLAVGNLTNPAYKLDVAGDINSSTALRVAGVSVCTSAGCTASTGSGSYIQNGTSLQASSNFNISGNGQIGGTLAVTGAVTVGSLNASSGGITNAGSITGIGANLTATGATTLQATAGTLALVATGANKITLTTNGAATPAVTVDSNNNVGIGRTAPIAQLDVAGKVPAAYLGFLSTSAASGPGYIAVQGRYAYMLAGNTLQAIDVSNPASPVSMSTVATGTLPNGIAVQGKYAYVVNQTSATLQVIDISNPAVMTVVSTVSTISSPKYIVVQGRYAFVAANNGNPATIQAFDISNSSNVVSLGTVLSGNNPDGLAIQGHYLYVSLYGSGIQSIDISNPAAMVSLQSLATGGGPGNIAVQGRYLYIANYNTSTVQAIDISNPSSMASVSTVAATGTNLTDIVVQGRYVYALSFNNVLQAFDVSNPASMTALGSVTAGSGKPSLAVQGRYGYVASGNGFSTYDLGGAYIQQLETGGIETGALAVKGNASIDGQLSVTGGASVSGSLQAKALAIGAGSSFTGNLIDISANGGRAFAVNQSGNVTQSAFSFQNVYQTTTAEASFTDVSALANANANWNLFKNAAALNDRTYFGYSDASFRSIYFTKNTGTQTTGTITWEVCTAVTTGTCTTWSAISGGSDATTNLTASGLVSWTNTAVQATVNNTSSYWLRASVATAGMSVQANGTITVSNPGSVVAYLIQPAGQAASGTLSASGTLFVANAPTGFTGDLVNLQVNGASKFAVDSTGNLNAHGTPGTSTTNSTVLQGGSSGNFGTYMFAGPGGAAVGSHSVAFYGGTAAGDTSFAFGSGSSTTFGKTYGFAFGANSAATGDFAIAVGNTATASGSGSVVFGNQLQSSSTGTSSFAFGAGIQAAANYSYAFGRGISNNGLSNKITGSLIYGTNNNTSTLYTRGGGSYAGAGTVASTSGSTTVTGTSTTFTTDFIAGDRITIGANTYVVSVVTDATHLTITVNALATVAGSAYTVLPALFKLQDSTATPVFFASDQGNIAVGNLTNPAYKLDVAGDVNSSTALRVAGTQVCTSTGCTASTGSGSYIQNGTSLQASSNFNISGNGQIGGTLSASGQVSLSGGTGTTSALTFTALPPTNATTSLVQMGNALTSGSASGTYIGINPTAFSGNFEDYSINGASKYSVSSAGAVLGGTYNGQTISSAASFTGTVAIANTLTVSAGGANITGTVAVTGSQTISSTLTVPTITSTGTLAVTSAANGDITVTPNGTGKIKLTVSGNAASAVIIGDGGTTNYAKFDTSGALSFVGAARPYSEMYLIPNDVLLPGAAACTLSAATAGSDGTNPVLFKTVDCTVTNKDAFWELKMPQNYVNGSNVQVDVYWISSVTTNASTFDVGYASVGNGADFNGAAVTNVAGGSVTTNGTAKYLNTSTVTLTAPSINADDLVSLRIRNSANTLTVPANIVKVRVKFLVGS
jgi:parallel beta-helix repeat protein